VSGQALHAGPALLKTRLFGRTSGLLVSPDGGAVEERHPQLDPLALLRLVQQTLPNAMTAPAVEGLCRHPPWSQMRRNAASFRAVVVPPDDRLDGAAQVSVLGLVGRAARLNQRRQLSPLSICQNAITRFICHGRNIGIDLKG
jgi:hypothetical protein